MKKLPFKTEHLLLGICTICCLYSVWKLNEIHQEIKDISVDVMWLENKLRDPDGVLKALDEFDMDEDTDGTVRGKVLEIWMGSHCLVPKFILQN